MYKEDGTPKITPELIQKLESKVDEYHAQIKDYYVSHKLDNTIKSLNKLRLVSISETVGDKVIFDEVVDFNSVGVSERKQLLELGNDIYEFTQLYQAPFTDHLHSIEKLLSLYHNNIPFNINDFSCDIVLLLNTPIPKVPTREEASRKVEEFKARLNAINIKEVNAVAKGSTEDGNYVIYLSCICLLVAALVTGFIFYLIYH